MSLTPSPKRALGLGLGFGLVLAAACDCSDDGTPGTAGTDGATPGELDGSIGTGDGGPLVRLDGSVTVTEDGGFSWTCVPITCDGHNTECGDCVDNDGDGRIDSRDQECLGPCDNTEGPQLTTGVGGEGGTSCNRDCYFDFGNGHGNDTCRWDTLCDSKAPDVECPHEADELGGMRCPATQTGLCLDVCRPLTPNGCDCFGCCTFDVISGRAEDAGGEWIWLGSGVGEGPDGEGTCTFDLINDNEACKPCIPVADCFNDCGECELCLGRTSIPDYCLEPPPDAGVPDGGMYPPQRCDPGVQACGLPGDPECPAEYYCITGCCVNGPI
jgi:hypothetical protein